MPENKRAIRKLDVVFSPDCNVLRATLHQEPDGPAKCIPFGSGSVHLRAFELRQVAENTWNYRTPGGPYQIVRFKILEPGTGYLP